MNIGVIGAMQEEIMLLKDELDNVTEHILGTRTFYKGAYGNKNIIMSLSGWGKSAAASTITSLINVFNVDTVIFIGLAGSLKPQITIGDIVIADCLIQYDVEMKDLTTIGEVNPPFYKNFSFNTDKKARIKSISAVDEFILQLKNNEYSEISSDYIPRMHVGAIGTGDKFVGSSQIKYDIVEKYPNLLCTEMEGAAIAQIANDYNIPCSVIRIISDNAETGAHDNFAKFLFENVSKISVEIMKILIKEM